MEGLASGWQCLLCACLGLSLGHLGAVNRVLVRLRLRDRASLPVPRSRVAPVQSATHLLTAGMRGQATCLDSAAQHLRLASEDLTELLAQTQTLVQGQLKSKSEMMTLLPVQAQVGAQLSALIDNLQQTASSLEAMDFSHKEVAESIQDLSLAAEETAAAMSAMNASLAQVENNATASTQLSLQVNQTAEAGVAAIEQTIFGIDKIKDNGRAAAAVIGELSQNIVEVTKILSVIDDVAEQTNLLALNAAIIAAQAGEHGRGFAVVADEIKDLAERTGASTREIAEIITRVQQHSERATDVMAQGVVHMEEGLRLGHNAEGALHNIVSSAQRSAGMMQAIAQATAEQARGSQQVNASVARIATTVAQISFATHEQARGSEQVMLAASGMKSAMVSIQVALGAEADQAKLMVASVDALGTQANEVVRLGQQMAGRSSQIAREVEFTRGNVVDTGACIDTILACLDMGPRPSA